MGLLRGSQPKPPEPEKQPEQEVAEAVVGNRRLDERERVGAWRLLTLMDAGYPYEVAAQIASRFDIDIERARKLMAEGWTPRDCARVLL